MDVATLSTSLATSAVGQQVDVGVMRALQNLDKNVTAELFSSLGLGQGIDAYA